MIKATISIAPGGPCHKAIAEKMMDVDESPDDNGRRSDLVASLQEAESPSPSPQMAQQSEPVRSVLGILWERRLLIVCFVLLGAGLGAWGAAVATRSYEADGALLYRFDREYLADDSSYERWRGDGIRIDIDSAIHTDLEILGSQRLLGMTLDLVGPPPATEPGPLDKLKDRVAAAFGGGDDIDQAMQGQQGASSSEGLSPEMLERRRGIDALRRDLSIRRVQGTTVANVTYQHPDPARALRVLQTLFDLYLTERRVVLDRTSGQALGKALDAARAEHSAAEAKRAAFVQDNALQNADARIASLRAEKETLQTALAEPAPSPDPASPAAPSPLLEERVAEIDAELQVLETASAQLASLSEKAALLRDEVVRVERLYFQQRLSEQVQAASASPIVVLDAPNLNPEPVGLSAPRQVALSASLGLMLGVLLAIVLDLLAKLRGGTAVSVFRRNPGPHS